MERWNFRCEILRSYTGSCSQVDITKLACKAWCPWHETTWSSMKKGFNFYPQKRFTMQQMNFHVFFFRNLEWFLPTFLLSHQGMWMVQVHAIYGTIIYTPRKLTWQWKINGKSTIWRCSSYWKIGGIVQFSSCWFFRFLPYLVGSSPFSDPSNGNQDSLVKGWDLSPACRTKPCPAGFGRGLSRKDYPTSLPSIHFQVRTCC